MNQFKYIIIFILFATVSNILCLDSLTGLLSFGKTVCPVVNPVQNFNLSAWSGNWHEIARYPNFFEIFTTCVTIKQKYHDGIISGSIVNSPLNSVYPIEGIATHANNNQDGALKVELKYGLPSITISVPVVILAVDYDHYGIVHSCFTDKFTGATQEMAWAIARTTALDEAVKSKIVNELKSLKVLDLSRFIWIDHTVCQN